MRVKLSDILDALELQCDEATYYLDRETGEVLFVTDEASRAAEDGTDADMADWMLADIAVAKRVAQQPDRHLELPTSWDINEYSMMEEFALSRDSDEHCDELESAIRGRGAFRRFKDTAHRIGQIEAWYRYRDAALKQVAIDWLESEGFDYVKVEPKQP